MIKRKALILTGIIILACVTVTGYQFKDNKQLLNLNNPLQNPTNSNINDINNAVNQESSNNSEKSVNHKTESKTNIKKSDSQSIASKYIEEPGAVTGKPQRIKIGGKQTDVVPVISNGKQVGEIHIDPKTGENVGGAGGAP